MHGPFSGYVRTKKVNLIISYSSKTIMGCYAYIVLYIPNDFCLYIQRKHAPANGYHGVYGIDCEMCYTTNGMEVIQNECKLSYISISIKI